MIKEPYEGPPTNITPEDYPLDEIINLGLSINQNYNCSKIAIIDCSKEERTFTFDEISNLSNAVSLGLLNYGIKQGDRVAILAKNCTEFLITLYGIFRIGAVAVPLNYKMSTTDIKFMLDDSKSKLVFCDNFTHHLLDDSLPIINFENNFKAFLINGTPVDVVHVNNIDDALILYTGGTTGYPKGVIISHANHLWVINRHRYKDCMWGPKRISLMSAPLYHMNGLSTMQGAISSHSTLVLLSEFEAIKYIKTIEKHNVNSLYAVTPMIAMILNEKPLIDSANLSTVRAVHMASAPLSRKLLDSAKRYFPNAWITNSYGSTETGPRIFGGHPDGIPIPELSVGCPIPVIPVRIIDGILQVKSPGMMAKYNNRSDLYEKFVTADGYFITNDLFTVDEQGFYYFAGRADDMFKSGGNTIYPSKIEEILELNPKVMSACVLGIDDDIKGKKPYAFVIPNMDNLPTTEELRTYILDNCPTYMLPREIWFVHSFPLTGPHKIDKKQLLALALTNLNKSA